MICMIIRLEKNIENPNLDKPEQRTKILDKRTKTAKKKIIEINFILKQIKIILFYGIFILS